MYTLRTISHAVLTRRKQQSSRVRPERITQFRILLIENEPVRARQAIRFLNEIANKGSLRGIVPVVLVENPDRALDFLQDFPYVDLRFIVVNGIDHSDDLEEIFATLVELQELYEFSSEIELLTHDWTSTFACKLLDIHTKKRATNLVAAS